MFQNNFDKKNMVKNYRSLIIVSMMFLTFSMATAMVSAVTFMEAFGNEDNEVAIVVGSDASATDFNVARQLRNFLIGDVIGNGNASGEVFRFQRASNQLNLGETLTDIETSALDENDLPTLLAEETFITDANEEFDYDQEITLSSGLELQWFEDSDFNEDDPMIGIRVARDTSILNYTIDFQDGAESELDGDDLVDFENAEISILGIDFTIIRAENDTRTLELLGGATEEILRVNEQRSFVLDGTTYDIELIFVDDDEARISINGQTTPSLSEGETFTLRNGVEIGVTEIDFQNFAGGIQQIEFIIGAYKMLIVDGQEIEINDEEIDDLFGYISMSAGTGDEVELDSITISWIPDEDVFLTTDNDLVMPELNAIRFIMDDFVTPANEFLGVEFEGDDTLVLDVVVEDGRYGDLPILSGDGDSFTVIGEDSSNQLATSNTDELTFNTEIHEWMVASWNDGDDAESYILDVTDINDEDGSTEVTVRNLVTNDEDTADEGDSIEFGNVILTVESADENNNTVTFSINNDGSFNRLYTQEGLTIVLPVDGSGFQGAIDLGNTTSSYALQFIEEDEDENIADGSAFNITTRWSSDELGIAGTNAVSANLSGVGFIEIGNTDEFVAYIESPLATRISINTDADPDDIEIEYHGAESYAEIYLGGREASIGNRTGSNGDRVMIVTDDELTNVTNMNLIVIGGSCVNTISADLLDVNYPTCGSNFSEATEVESGEFIVETFDSPVNGNGIATLIAGYNADDTRRAAELIIEEDDNGIDFDVGRRFIGGFNEGVQGAFANGTGNGFGNNGSDMDENNSFNEEDFIFNNTEENDTENDSLFFGYLMLLK